MLPQCYLLFFLLELHPLTFFSITQRLIFTLHSAFQTCLLFIATCARFFFIFFVTVLIKSKTFFFWWQDTDSQSTWKTRVAADLFGKAQSEQMTYITPAQGLPTSYGRMQERCGGREGRRFQFCWSVGSAGGHVPVQFHCHSRDGGRGGKEKHLAEQELHQHPLTERIRAFDYLHSEISELFTHQNRQRSTRTIASSPFCDPVCTLSCGDMNLHATLLNSQRGW